MLVDREWGMGNGGDEEERRINNQCPMSKPNSLLPTPHSPFYDALIIGKKRGKLLTASIIEFDLLFNAYA